eukprot:g56250.t1
MPLNPFSDPHYDPETGAKKPIGFDSTPRDAILGNRRPGCKHGYENWTAGDVFDGGIVLWQCSKCHVCEAYPLGLIECDEINVGILRTF